MDALFEILGGIFGELYIEMVMTLITSKKIKKRTEVFLTVLCCTVFLATFLVIAIGAYAIVDPESADDKRNGIIMLSVGISVVVMHIVMYAVNSIAKKRRIRKLKSVIGQTVHVTVDRKLGTAHPKYPNMIYEVNYGYIAGILGGDGEEQDAYVLGVDEPIDEFDGVVIAVIHRLNDNENKWVVAPHNAKIGVRTIRKKTYFTERYFNSEIIKR